MYQFQKKSGVLVDFDRNKIITAVIKAGATADQANQIASDVDNWLPTAVVNNIITASEVRTKVVELLRSVNFTAASSYESYIKS